MAENTCSLILVCPLQQHQKEQQEVRRPSLKFALFISLSEKWDKKKATTDIVSCILTLFFSNKKDSYAINSLIWWETMFCLTIVNDNKWISNSFGCALFCTDTLCVSNVYISLVLGFYLIREFFQSSQILFGHNILAVTNVCKYWNYILSVWKS